VEVELHSSSTSALRGEWSVSSPGERLLYIQRRGSWVGPRASLDIFEEKINPLALPEFKTCIIQPAE
jgi:hypothetical protein